LGPQAADPEAGSGDLGLALAAAVGDVELDRHRRFSVAAGRASRGSRRRTDES
jgi:hypothetical protein